MAEDFPDFTRAVRLLGVDDAGDLVTVLVDSAGNLAAILKGTTVADVLRAVRVDDAGQILAVLRGADDVDVAVDASGFLAALVKGIDGGSVLRTLAVDASGQLVMVPRGQSGNYMAIDASGYMTAVLKGVRDSVLTTIGVDAEGRIEAFGLDAEDQWGSVLRTGNSELAARLGSSVTWDWRGNVLYAHDFSTGYGPVQKTPHGNGAAVDLGPERAGFGGYALKMTSGSGDWDYAQCRFYVGSNPSARIGIAARFAIDGNTGYAQVHVEHQEGANSPYGSLWLDVANSQLQIYLTATGWTDVGAVVVNTYGYTYCWLKLVINQDTGYYERALYNETEIDLSAYPCPTLSSSYVGSIMSSFVNYGRTANNDVVYLDQLVLTVNEPVNA